VNEQMRTVGNKVSMGLTWLTRADRRNLAYRGLNDWAQLAVTELSLPVVREPEVSSMTRETLAVMASHALGYPLGMCNVRERVGRVYLVGAIELEYHADPELPLCLVNLGEPYERTFRTYFKHVARFVPHQDVGVWWRRAHKLCARCLDNLEQVAGRLSVQELVYLVVRLQVPLAWPRGKDWAHEQASRW